jgi:hypothetical protein
MNMKKLHRLITSVVFLIFATVAQADLNIFAGGASGEYFNPDRDLEGFFVEIVQQDSGRAIVVAWYTYDLGREMWLVGSAALTDGAESVEIPLEVFSGTDFGEGFSTGEVQREDWGSVTFSFPDCGTAKADYASDLDFGTGSIELTRLTNVVGVSCTN